MNPVRLGWALDIVALALFLIGAHEAAVVVAIGAAIVLIDGELDARLRDRRRAARRRNRRWA